MINCGCLIKDIETLREKLCHYLLYLEPTDSKVINISQELDRFIVLYEKNKFIARDRA